MIVYTQGGGTDWNNLRRSVFEHLADWTMASIYRRPSQQVDVLVAKTVKELAQW
ncbi:MAG: hypothetical protein V3S14_06085 [Anaerolineae bacterium]